ncbi:gamma-glutamyl hydrolase-like isoform X1 [Rhopilema esculentum]|uniref:gamma-glutamyl hydrolase-like isoform X1 n=1 Tax=Rhopilema esculentum TaxID=499914 RepID=UPI0031D7825F
MQTLKLVFAHCLFLLCAGNNDFSTYPKNFEEIRKSFKTDRPTIGVLTMANNDKKLLKDIPNATDTTYVSSSYVKLIEAGGARAVPLIADLPDDELMKIIKSINGVILSGGDGKLYNSHYDKVAKMVHDYSMKKMEEEGEHWPILGICRGSQILPVFTEKKDFLQHTDSKNYSIPLEFYGEYKKSKLFGHASDGVIETLKSKPITINAHKYSLLSEYFLKSKILTDFYRVISLNDDKEGVRFVSTYEARRYPIYGLQWHPEKLLFVWNPMMAADHSIDSIRVAQYIANFFVMEARRNSNRFSSREEEEKYLIYRWKPTYIGDIPDTPYEQVYLFPRNREEL